MPNITNKSIKWSNIRMIESILYNYNEMIKELNELKNDIILQDGDATVHGTKSTGISDPTLKKATAILTDRYVQETQKRIDAVKYTLDYLEKINASHIAEIIGYKYFKNLSDVDVSLKLNISMRTLSRWKKTALSIIASHLGYIIGSDGEYPPFFNPRP